MAMILPGMLAAVPTFLSVVALVVVVVAVQLEARLVEEPHLRATHVTYDAYAARAGRFVPGIGRVRSTSTGR